MFSMCSEQANCWFSSSNCLISCCDCYRQSNVIQPHRDCGPLAPPQRARFLLPALPQLQYSMGCIARVSLRAKAVWAVKTLKVTVSMAIPRFPTRDFDFNLRWFLTCPLLVRFFVFHAAGETWEVFLVSLREYNYCNHFFPHVFFCALLWLVHSLRVIFCPDFLHRISARKIRVQAALTWYRQPLHTIGATGLW